MPVRVWSFSNMWQVLELERENAVSKKTRFFLEKTFVDFFSSSFFVVEKPHLCFGHNESFFYDLKILRLWEIGQRWFWKFLAVKLFKISKSQTKMVSNFLIGF